MLYVNPASSIESFRADGVPNDGARRRAALDELDHLFAFTLLQEMRKSVPAEGLFGSSNERKTYEEMLDDALAGQMAKTGQLGVARQVEAQLEAMESNAARPVDATGFMPLHGTRPPMPLHAFGLDSTHGHAMPLPRQNHDPKVFPLIKAPMPIADN